VFKACDDSHLSVVQVGNLRVFVFSELRRVMLELLPGLLSREEALSTASRQRQLAIAEQRTTSRTGKKTTRRTLYLYREQGLSSLTA
jgi:hypothetical protein